MASPAGSAAAARGPQRNNSGVRLRSGKCMSVCVDSLRAASSLCLVLQVLLSSSPVAAGPVILNLSYLQGPVPVARNIRHLPCVSRKTNEEGLCMFAIDCLKANGTHLGTCIDRFYFGSCCQISDRNILPQIVGNNIDENSIENANFVHPRPADKYENHVNTIIESNKNKFGSKKPITSTTPTAETMEPRTEPPSTQNDKGDVKKEQDQTTTKNEIPNDNVKLVPGVTDSSSTEVPKTDTASLQVTEIPMKLSTFQSVSGGSNLVLDKSESYKPDNDVTESPKVTPSQSASVSSNSFPHKPFKPTYKPRPGYRPINYTRPQYANNKPRPTKPVIVTSTRKPGYRVPTKRPLTKKPLPIPPRLNITILPQATSVRPIFTKPSVGTTSLVNITSVKEEVKPATTTTSTTTTTTTSTTTTTTTTTTPAPITTTTTTTPAPTTTTTTTTPAPITTTTTTPAPTTTTTTTPAPTTTTTHVPTTTIAPTTTVLPTTVPPTITVAELTTTEMVQTTTDAIKDATEAITESLSPATTTDVTTVNDESTTEQTTKSPEEPQTESNNEEIDNPTLEIQTTEQMAVHTGSPKPIDEVPITSPRPSTEYPPLVTWSNPVESASESPELGPPNEESWAPVTPPEGWVLISTISPKPETTKKFTTPKISISTTTPKNIPNTSAKTEHPTISTLEFLTEAPQTTKTSEHSEASPNTTLSSPASSPAPLLEFTVNVTLSPTVPTSTSPGPTSTGPTSTGPTSTGPTSPGPTSPGPTSPGPSSLGPTSPGGHAEPATNKTDSVTSAESATASASTSTTTEAYDITNYKSVCGRRLWPQSRIVGGAKSGFGQWPWQISLRQYRTSNYLHKCGAALLNENWAITAAHCVDRVPPSELLVRLGEYDLASEEEPYGFTERRVQIIASHPHFDPATFEYDLALLRFYEPVSFQPNILPVCVPDDDDAYVGRTAYVTGWGRLYDEGPLPSVLQEVQVPVINNSECEAMYLRAGYNEHIPNIFICAGWRKGGSDSCEGDSGGPMVLQRERDSRFVLSGVISWGIGCAEPNQPGVYTRISEFRDWINQILQF